MPRPLLVAALAAAPLVVVAGPAQAHEVGLSRGDFRLEGSQVVANVVFARRELAQTITGLDADGDGALVEREVTAARSAIDRGVVAKIDLRADGEPCPGKLESAALVEEDGIRVTARFVCPAEPYQLAVDVPLLDELAPGHRQVASITAAGKPVDAVLSRRTRRFEAIVGAPPPGRGAPGGSALVAGASRIVAGYGHLVFLLGLVLAGGRWLRLAAAFAAFAVASTVGLVLGVGEVVTIAPRIVDAVIALSIVYVGAENYFVQHGDERWRIALPFGFLHGLGLATEARSVGIQRGTSPAALAQFGAGTAAAIALVGLVAIPVVLLSRDQSWFKNAGVKALSAAIALAGLYWLARSVGL